MATATPLCLAVFDMAGTTVQDQQEVERCFLQAAAATGLKADADAILPMMGWAKQRVFETLWRAQLPADGTSLRANVEASYQAFKRILEDHYRTAPVAPTVGCLATFDWLRSRGIPIALNTGFYREVTDIILQRLGWDVGLNERYIGTAKSPIQMSVTPSEIYGQEGRPAPYMIQKAMYTLGVTDPQTVVVVGDTPADLQAAHYGHCHTLGVCNGTHLREQLAAHPHDALLPSLAEFPAHVEALFGVPAIA
jgi:phosphonatase-like hydrolase